MEMTDLKFKGLWTPQYMAERLLFPKPRSIQDAEGMLRSWALDVVDANQPTEGTKLYSEEQMVQYGGSCFFEGVNRGEVNLPLPPPFLIHKDKGAIFPSDDDISEMCVDFGGHTEAMMIRADGMRSMRDYLKSKLSTPLDKEGYGKEEIREMVVNKIQELRDKSMVDFMRASDRERVYDELTSFILTLSSPPPLQKDKEEMSERIVEIDFGGNVKAKLSIVNNKISVIASMNGYGDPIDIQNITILEV